jgi:hypothetical protein
MRHGLEMDLDITARLALVSIRLTVVSKSAPMKWSFGMVCHTVSHIVKALFLPADQRFFGCAVCMRVKVTGVTFSCEAHAERCNAAYLPYRCVKRLHIYSTTPTQWSQLCRPRQF